MASIEIVSKRNWQPGEYRFPTAANFADGVTLPVGVQYVKLALDVTDMTDPAQIVLFDAELSFDGGATWKPERASFQGGPIKNLATRVPPFVSYHEFHFPEPTNANRRVRVTMTVAGIAARIASTVETR